MLQFTDKDEIEHAFQYYRKIGFPYPKLQKHEIIRIFREIQSHQGSIKKTRYKSLFEYLSIIKTIKLPCMQDSTLANYFHPHIFDSHAKGMRSPTLSFQIDSSLRKAIKLAKKWDKSITDKSVLTYLKIVNGTQVCSNFRPTAAKAIYEYLNSQNVLDMSTGYGGRLIGFCASGTTVSYTGIDPSYKTIKNNKKIKQIFQQDKKIRLICNAFEDVPLETLPKNIDTAFTSPPYFNKEIYDSSKKGMQMQSRERYKSYKKWCKHFLIPLIQKTKQCLCINGILALNIHNIKDGKKKYNIVQDSIKIAIANGFHLQETLYLYMPGFGKNLKKVKYEHVLIFINKNKTKK